MTRGDGYDDIRRAFHAGVAAAVAYSLNRKNGGEAVPPDAEAYVARLKEKPLIARLDASRR